MQDLLLLHTATDVATKGNNVHNKINRFKNVSYGESVTYMCDDTIKSSGGTISKMSVKIRYSVRLPTKEVFIVLVF